MDITFVVVENGNKDNKIMGWNENIEMVGCMLSFHAYLSQFFQPRA